MNDPREARELIRYLRNSYGKGMVSGEIEDFIIGQIKHIPSEAILWIRDQFKRRFKTCPEMLDTSILSVWHAWRHEHPDKCAGEPGEKKDCVNGNCYSGWMIWWKQEGFYGDRWMSFAVPCAECRRSGNSSVPVIDYKRGIERGWIPDSPEFQREIREEIAEEVAAAELEYKREGRLKARAA